MSSCSCSTETSTSSISGSKKLPSGEGEIRGRALAVAVVLVNRLVEIGNRHRARFGVNAVARASHEVASHNRPVALDLHMLRARKSVSHAKLLAPVLLVDVLLILIDRNLDVLNAGVGIDHAARRKSGTVKCRRCGEAAGGARALAVAVALPWCVEFARNRLIELGNRQGARLGLDAVLAGLERPIHVHIGIVGIGRGIGRAVLLALVLLIDVLLILLDRDLDVVDAGFELDAVARGNRNSGCGLGLGLAITSVGGEGAIGTRMSAMR